MPILRPLADVSTPGATDELRQSGPLYSVLSRTSGGVPVHDETHYVTTDDLDLRMHPNNGVAGSIAWFTDDEDLFYTTHPLYRRAKFIQYVWSRSTYFSRMIGVHSICGACRGTWLTGLEDWNSGQAGNDTYKGGTRRTTASLSISGGVFTDPAVVIYEIGCFVTLGAGGSGYIKNINTSTHQVTLGGAVASFTGTTTVSYLLGERATNTDVVGFPGIFPVSYLAQMGDCYMDHSKTYHTMLAGEWGGTGRRVSNDMHAGKVLNNWDSNTLGKWPSFSHEVDYFLGWSYGVEDTTLSQALEVRRDQDRNIISQGLWPSQSTTSNVNTDPYQYTAYKLALAAMRFIDECTQPYDAVTNPYGRQKTDKRYGLPFNITLTPGAPHGPDTSHDPVVCPAPGATLSALGGSSITLTFQGQTTTPFAWNASASSIRTALENLSNVAVGDFVVTGGGGTALIVYSDTGAFANLRSMDMQADLSAVTGGSFVIDPDFFYKTFLRPHTLDLGTYFNQFDRTTVANCTLTAGNTTYTDASATQEDVDKAVQYVVTGHNVLQDIYVIGVSGTTVTLSAPIPQNITGKIRYLFRPPQMDDRLIESGTLTSVTDTGGTKSGAGWATNALKNRVVLIGNTMGTIASNTSSTFTLDALGWKGWAHLEAVPTPTSLSYKIQYGFGYDNVYRYIYRWDQNGQNVASGTPAQSERARMGQLRGVDDAIAALEDFLVYRNLDGKTVRMYGTDNGVYRGNGMHWDAAGKDNCFESDSRIGLYAWGPGFTPKVTTNVAVNNMMIYPTLMEAMNIPSSYWTRSPDTTRTLFQAAKLRDPTIWDTEVLPMSQSNQAGVRTAKWKYFEYTGGGASGRSVRLQIVVPDGSGFTLDFLGQVTTTILPTDSAATMETILGNLSNLDATDILVTGSPGNWFVEFANTAGGIDGNYGGKWILNGPQKDYPLKFASTGGATVPDIIMDAAPQPPKNLYNMEDDPQEMNNLAVQGTPAVGSVQAQLATHMNNLVDHWSLAVNGPLPTFSG